ncbi:MAG: type II toxin-antitoxin system Phd/YefM family antitoxin [Patescibacteria group bacterium]
MITEDDIVTVSELRKNTLAVFKKMNKSKKPLLIFSDSKPVGVIMSITKYAELQMEYESVVNPQDWIKETNRLKKKGHSL